MHVSSARSRAVIAPEPLRPTAQRLQLVRPDAFVGAARAQASSSPYVEQITRGFQEQLGRAPTPEEIARFTELGAKVPPEQLDAAIRWCICAGPEWQARAVFREELGREPTADELQRRITWGNELVAQGKSTAELRAAFQFVTRMGPEWQARSVAQEELGRLPTAEELQRSVEWGNQLQAEGKSTAEIRQAFQYVTRMGPEWQARSAYQDMLGRLPTAEELQRSVEWGNQLVAEGKQTPDVRAAFNWVIAQTPEYQARRTPDRIREEIAQWAIAQANDPNVGYSQTAGRFGDRVDANGNRYFDCSGLVTAAYAQAGIQLGGNWTGAMRSTWQSWADEVPKDLSQMKPGDLILMDGHVVMYTGNGQCVGAQTGNTAFQDQVRTGIDAMAYLRRGDAIVLRPHV